MSELALDQRAVVNILGDWHYATIVGFDTCSQPGVALKFDYPVNGTQTCYATYEEVRPLWESRPQMIE